MTLKLYELTEEFEGLDDQDRLQVLIDFAETLPNESSQYDPLFGNEECRIQECQTPVFLRIGIIDGKTYIEADVPRKSPTVRGLVSLIVEGINQADPTEVLDLPDDLLPIFGLENALGMTRQQGVRGMMSRIKRDLRAAMNEKTA
ncbi:MAG: SufE family protein [Planctomycetaceae bacterium]|jgi:cysteine desulfuration protein SufE|nr:SufE family protein [bacterium]MDB4679752.1 SufE family protein [Planctomycetaceae bacterium]MDB4786951.1 SufE family protein [Planctomycetaceae bacterium]MDC0273211.1 SufE family protein [Planctomycetaceae bacterium]MDG2389361.1 SufE family protein [Planctomycetaceae bacterium]